MLLLLSVLSACFAASQAALSVAVTSSKVELQLEKITINNLGYEHYALPVDKPISLSCNVTASDGKLDGVEVTWVNSETKEVYESDERLSVTTEKLSSSVKSVLDIKYPRNEDVTDIICRANRSSDKEVKEARGSFLSRPLVQIKVAGARTRDVAVWPEQPITVLCVASGNPKPVMEWTKSLDDSFATSNTTVFIGSLNAERDRGFLTCSANNTYGGNKDKVFLRVKDPNSFVVPLIALLVQIAILAVIIVVYELFRRKQKTE